MKNLLSFALVTMALVAMIPLSSVGFAAPDSALTSFCGQIKTLYFKDHGGRIMAYGILTDLRTYPEMKPMTPKKIVLTDPKVTYKLAKVVSKTSVQNSEKLLKDLEGSNFEWDSLVGAELHPNPYEEDYQACLLANLSDLPEDKQLYEVIEIIDVLEDGYSIKDLLD